MLNMSYICDIAKHRDLNFPNLCDFESLKCVDRGSEIQLHVAENFNLMVQRWLTC